MGLASASFLFGACRVIHIAPGTPSATFVKPLAKIIFTTLMCLAAMAGAWLLYDAYENRPWTRDGQIRANIVGVAPRVAGPVVKIPVRDNQPVKKGDLLFQIDPSDYQATLNNAIGQLKESEAAAVQAKQELDRQTKLYATDVIDLQDFQNAQDAYAIAVAAVAAASANVELARLNLSYTTVLAPVDGYLTNVNTSPGTYVDAGQQLLTLVDTSTFWVAAYFKETQLHAIREGDEARVTLMALRSRPVSGRVVSVGWGIFLADGSTVEMLPQVSQTIDWIRLPQRFPVRIELAEESPIPLRIGQTASVSILPAAGQIQQ
jgi:multidrug resistance efflux pump